jgi:hypothetical protein
VAKYIIRGKRRPRRLSVEAVPFTEEGQRQTDHSLGPALAELLVALVSQKLEAGELVIENGIVRVNPKRLNHEQEF